MIHNSVGNMLIYLLHLAIIRLSVSFVADPSNSPPYFCINQQFHSIILQRFPTINKQVIEYEINRLKHTSANEYFRGYDLTAYYYYVLEPSNPYRKDSCDDAIYEYLPFLPFYWRPSIYSEERASKGIYEDSNAKRNVSAFISDILKFVEEDPHSKSDYKSLTRYRFTVGSPYNFRTLMGTGK